MATSFKTPSELADDYLLELESLKPTFNTDQTDSEWWIRSRVLGGLAGGVSADNRLISNDALPTRARHDALERFLDLYFQAGFISATQAEGLVIFSGVAGTTLHSGAEATYLPNGNVYNTTADVTMSNDAAATGEVNVISVAAGQNQNLLGGAILTLSSPPTGINSTATVGSDGLSDARDPETDDEARTRIVDRIRQPLSVGRISDYIQYARDADPSVVSASILPYPFGLGTVGVFITSGTTNIDQAVDNGEAVNVIPSDALVAVVQAFLEINKPVTDCVTVFKPDALSVNVVVKARYAQGDGSTIPSGQTLTQEQLVIREVNRALYKTPVGGRVFDGTGYVLASDIEETIDAHLADQANVQGTLQILSDRQVENLSATGDNLAILASQVPIPGTISVVSF